MSTKLTLHIGDDYACIMRPDETTDTAFVLTRYPSEDDVRELTVMAASQTCWRRCALRSALGVLAGQDMHKDALIDALAKARDAIAKAEGGAS